MHVEEYRHQVGGHCKLIKPKDSSKVYKPLIENEYIFYEKLKNFRSSSTESGPLHILKKFIPKFYGVAEIVIESYSDLEDKPCNICDKDSCDKIENGKINNNNEGANNEVTSNKQRHKRKTYKKYIKLNRTENCLEEPKKWIKQPIMQDSTEKNESICGEPETESSQRVEQVFSFNYKWMGVNNEQETKKDETVISDISNGNAVNNLENIRNEKDKEQKDGNINEASTISYIKEANTSKITQKRKECIPHIVLEDLVYGFKRPCVLDIKMGKRQRKIGASLEKKKRQVEKSFITTSHSLGFRLCGYQNYNKRNDKLFYKDKYWGRQLSKEKITWAIRNWLWNGTFLYEELVPLLLEKLHSFFNCIIELRHYRFWSTSLLWVFDGGLNDKTARSNSLDIRMIDFANTIYLQDNPSPDDEYIFGLKNLIESIQTLQNSLNNIYFLPYEIAASFFHDDYSTKIDSKKNNHKKCGSVNFEEKNKKNKKTLYINWSFLRNGRKCISEVEHSESINEEAPKENEMTEVHAIDTQSEQIHGKKKKNTVEEIKKKIKIIKWRRKGMKKLLEPFSPVTAKSQMEKKVKEKNGIGQNHSNVIHSVFNEKDQQSQEETKSEQLNEKEKHDSCNKKETEVVVEKKEITSPLGQQEIITEKKKPFVILEKTEDEERLPAEKNVSILKMIPTKSVPVEKLPAPSLEESLKKHQKNSNFVETNEKDFFKKTKEEICRTCETIKKRKTEDEIIQNVINRILKNIFQIRKYEKTNGMKSNHKINNLEQNNYIKHTNRKRSKEQSEKQLIFINNKEQRNTHINKFAWNGNNIFQIFKRGDKSGSIEEVAEESIFKLHNMEKENNMEEDNKMEKENKMEIEKKNKVEKKNKMEKENKKQKKEEKKKETEIEKKEKRNLVSTNIKLKILINQIIKFETKKKKREISLIRKIKGKEKKKKKKLDRIKNVPHFSDSTKNIIKIQKQLKKVSSKEEMSNVKTDVKMHLNKNLPPFLNYNSDFFIVSNVRPHKSKKENGKKKWKNSNSDNNNNNNNNELKETKTEELKFMWHISNSLNSSKRCCSCVDIQLKDTKRENVRRRKNKNSFIRKHDFMSCLKREKNSRDTQWHECIKNKKLYDFYRNENEHISTENSSNEFNIYHGENNKEHLFKDIINFNTNVLQKKDTPKEGHSKNLIVPLKETNENVKYLRKSLSEPNFYNIKWRYEHNYFHQNQINYSNLIKTRNDKLEKVPIYKQIYGFHSSSESTDSTQQFSEKD